MYSLLTRTLAPGVYYLAITNWNFANNLASPQDDDYRDGNVLDFANAAANSRVDSAINCSFAITDFLGTHPVSATKANPYDVIWFTFTVSPIIVLHDNNGLLPSPGTVVAGTDASVNVSDDSYWELRPGVVFSSAQDPCRVEFVGHAPGSTPSLLELVVESRASASGIRQAIQAFDYIANAWVDAGTMTILPNGASLDQTVIQPLAAANFIKPSSTPANEMRMRLSFRATAAVFSFPWKPQIDFVAWRYTP